MSLYEIALQVFKFISIGVSAASGWYATFYETKNTATGKLTKAGQVVFGLLVVSSMVALASQSLETANTVRKATEERNKAARAAVMEAQKEQEAATIRERQFIELGSILEAATEANKSSTESAKSSRESAEKSSTVVARLGSVAESQEAALEQGWRQQRPFGTWEVLLDIQDIRVDAVIKNQLEMFRAQSINAGKGSIAAWAESILERAKKPNGLESDGTVRETADFGPGNRWNSRDNPFNIMTLMVFFSTPAGKNRAYGGSEMTLTFRPLYSTTIAHVDQSLERVTSVDMFAKFAISDVVKPSSAIRNWIDLFGRTISFKLTDYISTANVLDLTVMYMDTISPEVLEVKCSPRGGSDGCYDDEMWVTRSITEDIGAYVPPDYEKLFPREYESIKQRLLISHRPARKRLE